MDQVSGRDEFVRRSYSPAISGRAACWLLMGATLLLPYDDRSRLQMTPVPSLHLMQHTASSWARLAPTDSTWSSEDEAAINWPSATLLL